MKTRTFEFLLLSICLTLFTIITILLIDSGCKPFTNWGYWLFAALIVVRYIKAILLIRVDKH